MATRQKITTDSRFDEQTKESHERMIEILILNLRPGTREEFRKLYISAALPLLEKWKFRVLSHGASLHDENSYYVTRSFENLEERQRMEDAYYASDDWQEGPRTAIFALVESYSTVVVPAASLKEWSDDK